MREQPLRTQSAIFHSQVQPLSRRNWLGIFSAASAGRRLLGSGDGKQYPAAEAIPLAGDSTLEDGNVGLIYAVKAENITVQGPGTIDGNGAQFFRAPDAQASP